jgi:peroxiredoxin
MIQRYHPWVNYNTHENEIEMLEDGDGEWVKWEDVEAKIREAFDIACEAKESARQARIQADGVLNKMVCQGGVFFVEEET